MKLNKDKVEVEMAKKQLSVANVAEAMGVTRQALYRYFNREVRPQTVGRLAEVLGSSVESIVD